MWIFITRMLKYLHQLTKLILSIIIMLEPLEANDTKTESAKISDYW